MDQKELLASALIVIVRVIGLWQSVQFAPQTISRTLTPEVASNRWIPIRFPGPDVTADFTSLKGFNLTWMDFYGRCPVLVLSPGGSGTILVTLIDRRPSGIGDEDYAVSLDIHLAGWPNPKFVGVRYDFSPSTLNLKAGTEATSILTMEADHEAPTALYDLDMNATIKGGFQSISPLSDLLIYPHTPSYAFHVINQWPSTSTLHAHAPAYGVIAKIAVERGEAVYIMFRNDKRTYWTHELVEVSIEVTSEHGFLPSGIDVKLDSIEVAPSPDETVIVLALTTTTDVPEGMYRMVTTIKMGAYIQIEFYLMVT